MEKLAVGADPTIDDCVGRTDRRNIELHILDRSGAGTQRELGGGRASRRRADSREVAVVKRSGQLSGGRASASGGALKLQREGRVTATEIEARTGPGTRLRY